MTIEWVRGDVFSLNADFLVNPVNCVGVSGKGLAAEFKKRFPKNYSAYRDYCNGGWLRPGNYFLFIEDDKTIVNFATKDHWRDDTKLEWLERGVPAMAEGLEHCFGGHVAIPALGCGLGCLRYSEVKSIFETAFADKSKHYYAIFPH